MAVRKINDIYAEYWQKSKGFLYPALNHKKGSSVTPIETYLSWERVVSIEDPKLVCLYYLREDREFILFEDKHLLNNPLFEDFKQVDDNKAVYIFNIEEHKQDYYNVALGKYSLLSQKLKNRIKQYHGASTAEYAFLDSYLYPEQYFDKYAEILCPDPLDIPEMTEILTEVGELCDKPNHTLEDLKIGIKDLDLTKIQ